MHDGDRVRDPKNDVHVVLAEKQGESVLRNDPVHKLHRPLGLVRRHAGSRLIKEQQSRAQRKRDRQLQRSLVAVRQKSRLERGGRSKANRLQELHGLVPVPAIGETEWAHGVAAMRKHRVLKVLQHRQLREDVGDLEGSTDSKSRKLVGAATGDIDTAEENLAGVRSDLACQQVEES